MYYLIVKQDGLTCFFLSILVFYLFLGSDRVSTPAFTGVRQFSSLQSFSDHGLHSPAFQTICTIITTQKLELISQWYTNKTLFVAFPRHDFEQCNSCDRMATPCARSKKFEPKEPYIPQHLFLFIIRKRWMRNKHWSFNLFAQRKYLWQLNKASPWLRAKCMPSFARLGAEIKRQNKVKLFTEKWQIILRQIILKGKKVLDSVDV